MACVICKGVMHGEATQEVRTKGLKNLIRCSLLREDGLVEVFQNVDSIVLHSVCYRRYIVCRFDSSGVYMPCCGINPRRKPSRNPVKFVFTAESNDTNSNVADAHNIPVIRNSIEINADKNDMNVKVEPKGNFKTNDQNLLDSIDSTNLCMTNSETQKEIAYISVTYDNDSSELQYCPLKNKYDILHSLDYEHNKDNPSESDKLQAPNEDDLTKCFPFEHLCVICAKDISEKYIANEKKKPQNKRTKVVRVSKEATKLTLLKCLSQTIAPEGQVIKQRIQDVDLVQVKAGYHSKCLFKVYNGLKPKGSGNPIGRQLDARISVAMDKIFRYIEEVNHGNYTSTELMDLLDEEEKFSIRTLKARLKRRYGDNMYYTTASGLASVFTFVRDSTGNTSAEKSGDKTLNRQNAKGSKITKKSLLKNPKNINYEDSFEDPPCSPGSDLPTERSASDTNTLCHICWSDNRQLEGLGEYADVCWRICGDDFKVDSVQLLVCWECRASLRHALRFQQRARASTWFLNGEMEWKCLSSMSVVTPALSLISCKPDKTQTRTEDDYADENTDIDTQNTEHLVKVEVETYPEEHVDEDVPQASSDDEREMDHVASGDDGEGDHPPAPKRTRRSTTKTTDKKSIETYPEEHVDGDVPQASNDDERETDDFAFSDDDRPPAPKRPRRSKKKITDITSRESGDDNSSSSSSENNDPDWEAKQMALTKKTSVKKTSTADRYTQYCGVKTKDDGDFDADSLIEVVRIEPQEINEWREKERDSTYFRGLEKKCETCITVIEEDHDSLYHCLDSAHVCSVCSARCRTAAELDSHLAAHCSLYRCAVCRYQCCARAHITAHVHLHRRIYQCLECGHGLRSLDVLKEHFNDLHRFSVCDHCGKQFPHKLHLEKHIQRAHAPHICTKCNKEFNRYYSFKEHMDLKHHISRTELAYCVQCDIQFDNEKLMKRHLYHSRNHVNEWKRGPPKPKPKQKEEHKCPACQKVYAKRSSMRDHYRYEHTKEIAYYCQHCNKSFLRKETYKNHMMFRHQGYKPPKNKICEFCGRGFSTKRTLANHVRTHTGERPFACEHCPAAFAQRIALRTHVKHIHLGLKRGARTASTGAPANEEQSYPA